MNGYFNSLLKQEFQRSDKKLEVLTEYGKKMMVRTLLSPAFIKSTCVAESGSGRAFQTC